jgi:hypothetical protein
MPLVKKKHPRVDFNLPSAEAVIVRSVSGREASVAELRAAAARPVFAFLPAAHPSEDDLQIDAYASLWNLNFAALCYGWHTPNGGSRDAVEAMKFKSMGVRRGVPDLIFITAPARVIFIELKNGHHRLEPDQELFVHKALGFGFTDVYCCGTLREVAALLCHIFDVEPAALVFA